MSSSPMEIDDSSSPEKTTAKGKTLILEDPPSGQVKATPWVEKYRPQSLADVAAHRDIVDTSPYTNPPFSLVFLFLFFPSVALVFNFYFFVGLESKSTGSRTRTSSRISSCTVHLGPERHRRSWRSLGSSTGHTTTT